MVRGYCHREVIGILRGGLGNQLFQLVGYSAIARLNKKRLALDVGTFCHPSQVSLGRKLEISEFAIFLGGRVMSTSRFKSVERFKSSLVWGIRSLLDLSPFTRLGALMLSEKRGLGKLPEVSFEGLRLVDGYFGDVWGTSLFQQTLDLLVDHLVDARTRLPTALVRKYKGYEVTVHMRLGDMVSVNKGLLSDLDRALSEIADRPGTRILVFSDEPPRAEAILHGHGLRNFEFAPTNLGAVETLLLMSLARRLYCSPSTFSWWAAVVASRDGSVIHFPNQVDQESDLLTVPEGWVRY